MGASFVLGKDQDSSQKSWVERELAVTDGLPKDGKGIFKYVHLFT